MIYLSLDKAKEDFRWLTQDCFLTQFSASRISAYEQNNLENRLMVTDDKSIKNHVAVIFGIMKIKEPSWSEHIGHRLLPALALIPDVGLRVIVEKEADDSWKSDGVEGVRKKRSFPKGTLFTAIKSERKMDDEKTSGKMFKDIAMSQKPMLIKVAVASVSINLLAVVASIYSMQVYDRVIPTHGMQTLAALTIGVIVAIVLELVIKISRSVVADHASKNMDTEYAHNIFNRFLKIRTDALPKSVGTVSGQLQSYSIVRSFISAVALFVVIDFPFSMIFLAVIGAIAGWYMALIVFIFLSLSILMGLAFRKKIDGLTAASNVSSNKKLGLLVETVENAENVKATGAGWNALGKWNALTEDSINDEILIKHYTEMVTYLSSFFQQMGYVALVGVGAFLVVSSDTLTMGGLIATTILSGRVMSPIANLPNILVQWGRSKMVIKNLDDLYRRECDNHGVERPLSPVLSEFNLECANVKFSYGEHSPVMALGSLIIKKGERVAIIGIVGSGKSTLLKMLSGLYKPQEGNVKISGIDMQHISRNKINEVVGYFPQNTRLLSGSLRDNLLLGLVGISDEVILEAANKTGLIELINNLPQGLDTPVPEGGESVSGGQKQIIALTRILLASPKVWLLDEPTSGMDDATENKILNIIHREIGMDKTLLVVTHKQALLGLVNRVIVMSPKGIVMDGPRDIILNKLSTLSKERQ